MYSPFFIIDFFYIINWNQDQSQKQKIVANQKISAQTVRLIDPEGNNLGIIDTSSAIKQAKSQKLDLIQVFNSFQKAFFVVS